MIVPKTKKEDDTEGVVSSTEVETTTETETESSESESSGLTVEEAVKMNPLIETYKTIKSILVTLRQDENDPNSPPLFRTVKWDNGQFARITNETTNEEYAIAFPAVFIHYIDVASEAGTSGIIYGTATLRIRYVLNRLNNSDEVVELEGLVIYNKIVKAIEANKKNLCALITEFELSYWDQPESFSDGLQPYWISYSMSYTDYSNYTYQDWITKHFVFPPYTNHYDQETDGISWRWQDGKLLVWGEDDGPIGREYSAEENPEHHDDHTDVTYDDVSGFELPEDTD